jgi:hypothetical protein
MKIFMGLVCCLMFCVNDTSYGCEWIRVRNSNVQPVIAVPQFQSPPVVWSYAQQVSVTYVPTVVYQPVVNTQVIAVPTVVYPIYAPVPVVPYGNYGYIVYKY